MKYLCLIIMITFMYTISLFCEEKSSDGYISGLITDATTKSPLANVSVSLVGKKSTKTYSSKTKADGTYSIKAEPDNYVISFSLINYKTDPPLHNFTVTVSASSTVSFNVSMTAIETKEIKYGKIQGKIIDANAGNEISGATIVIDGMALGASSDVGGTYFILKIPAGVYSVTCLLPGYVTKTQPNITVSENATTVVNFSMIGKLAGSEEVVIDGKRPIIKKDNTSSPDKLDSSDIKNKKLPIIFDEKDKTGKSDKTSKTDTEKKPSDSSAYTDKTKRDTDSSSYSVDTSRIPKAGEHDDNEEFPAFLTFFERFNTTAVELDSFKKDIEGRVLISVLDTNGHPIKDAKLEVNGRSFYSANDGDILLFPSDIGVKGNKKIKAVISTRRGQKKTVELTANTAVRQQVTFDFIRTELSKVPVDIVFTMDTTGSMGDEIDILRDTIYSIYTRINKLENTSISLRFGMVLFRDKGDSYVTQQFPLTDDIEKFQEFLFNVRSGGGGDTPEDLIAGLDETVSNMNWNNDAVKLAFIITDAPGHMNDTDRYRTVLNNARINNIKLFAVGASGLTTEGEIHLRITAQTTKGAFIFLTYGETGESSGKDEGKVSHHTGTNFTSRNLDDIVVDNVARQIRYLVPASALTALQQKYDFKGEEERITIRTDNAFQQIVRQLKSKLTDKTTVLVLPPDCDVPSLKEMSVFVNTFLEKSIVDNKFMSVVDRSKLDKVMQEIQLKLMGLTEGEDFSKLAHADTILASRLYYLGDSKVLFLRLISTDTSEVLAASMVRI